MASTQTARDATALNQTTPGQTSPGATSGDVTSGGTARQNNSVVLSVVLPGLYPLFLLALCAAFAWRPLTGSDDFWAHAAVGRWIWSHAQVPSRTLFLWSADVPWVAHSWLSQLVFYGLMRLGQSLGGGASSAVAVQVFTLLLVMLPFALLWRLWRRSSEHPASLKPLLFALGVFVSSLRFHPRPELFTASLLTATLLFLIAWPASPEGAPQTSGVLMRVSGLCLLFVLWANLHGAVAMGFLILSLSVVCDLVQDRFDRRALWLAAVAILCGAMTLFNPFGIELWRDVWRSTGSAMFSRIEEWQPPLRSRFLWSSVLGEAVLAAAALWAWHRNPRRRWSQAAWVLVMSILFLRQRRHLWLLALVSLAVLSANARGFDQGLTAFWERCRQLRAARIGTGTRATAGFGRLSRSGFLAQGGVLGILTLAIAIALPLEVWPPRAVSPLVPERAATWIERHHKPGGHLFNDYENSSYLQWRLNGAATRGVESGRVSSRGRFPLFIDLLNAYPQQVVDDYIQIINALPKGRARLQTLGIGCVILSVEKRESPLARFLDSSPAWHRVYNGDDGTIWRCSEQAFPLEPRVPNRRAIR